MLNAGQEKLVMSLLNGIDDYRAPRAVVMATEMLAQAYAYLKVGRPTNYRQALPVRSGSSEFFNTDNIRQARGFVIAAKRYANNLSHYPMGILLEELIRWTKAKFAERWQKTTSII